MYSTGRWFNDKGFERTVPWSSVPNKQEPSSWYYAHNFPEEDDDRWLKTVAVSGDMFWAPSIEILVNFQVQAVACCDLLDFIYYFEMCVYIYTHTVDSSKTIGNFPGALSFNLLFVKLDQVIL